MSGHRLANVNVTNEALPHLTAFPKLRQLGLKETQATDEDLRIVGALKNLERFYFWDAKTITNEGVSHLSGLAKLENIHLSFSQIGDEGLRVLAQIPNMQFISVQGGHFTDRGLEFLKDKDQLRGLWVGIGATKITDAGVRHLSGLTKLKHLELQTTDVTDAGIEYLKGLTNLETLLVSNTKVVTDDHSDLRWDKVIMSGISHGSTTAARFAKHQRVARVVMFSGPRDQLESWQSLPSATPENRYFGFTHVLDDGWKNDHYCRSWLLLGLAKFGRLVDVDRVPAPYGNSRRLITNADVGNNAVRAHLSSVPGGAAVKKDNGEYAHEAVWRYLFTHPVDQVGDAVAPEADCMINQRK